MPQRDRCCRCFGRVASRGLGFLVLLGLLGIAPGLGTAQPAFAKSSAKTAHVKKHSKHEAKATKRAKPARKAAKQAKQKQAKQKQAKKPKQAKRYHLETLSAAPQQVTGGDVLVRVVVPARKRLDRTRVFLNGTDVSAAFAPEPDRHALLGLVEGLAPGKNRLRVSSDRRARKTEARLMLHNHPASGPIFSGPQQQPFVCATARAGLGQPLVDNQESFGIAVAREAADGSYPRDGRGYPTAEAEIVGWSRNCAAETRIEYRYRSTDGAWQPLADPTGPLPADLAMTTTLDGRTVPYIVRWERGTNNRFLYSVAMLAPTNETDPYAPDDSLWNGRLVFSLQGGVAIGHHQGSPSTSAQLVHDVLRLGYAVVNSTGLRTNTHYNLQLGGETALMLKEYFIETHGVPLYTVGVGGSGGGIQQYIYGQNHPGLLDAGIPQYSYSDMITQTVHVGDCELLEHYFDVTDGDNPRWLDIQNRRRIEGLNASDHPKNQSEGEMEQWNLLNLVHTALGLPVPQRAADSPTAALTECRRAWFGLSPLVLNPSFTSVSDLDKLAQGAEGVEWTHAADMVNVYGLDDFGFARTPWSNEGVQYGLQALTDGAVTPEEFLKLNAQVGSWKPSKDLVPEGFPFEGDDIFGDFDPWSSRNIALSPDGGTTPAPRRSGDRLAIRAAHEAGLVFTGSLEIPLIDWRHYLEAELDMHHSHQSFATRQRLLDGQGHFENQLVWFTDARPERAFDQTPEAFEVIDEWMANLRAHPERGVAGNKPPRATDRCFTTEGEEIASGPEVWQGILDDGPAGVCTERFPVFQTTRMVAGGSIAGGIFQCQLQPVAQALARGLYGSWTPSPEQRARLELIFPTGVCDYSRPDAHRP